MTYFFKTKLEAFVMFGWTSFMAQMAVAPVQAVVAAQLASSQQFLTPDNLISMMGTTPADTQGMNDIYNPASEAATAGVKLAFKLDRAWREAEKNPLLWPFSWLPRQAFRMGVIEPIKDATKKAVRTGIHPDIFFRENEEIEGQYAELLTGFLANFIENGEINPDKQHWARSSSGRSFLVNFLLRFSRLEWQYHSFGPSPLTALKELLKCGLMVILNAPLSEEPWPFADPKGEPFEAYLGRIERMLLNLYEERAFNLVDYAFRKTEGQDNFTPCEVVPGSQLECARLLRFKPERSAKALIYAGPALINNYWPYDMGAGQSIAGEMTARGYGFFLGDIGQPRSVHNHLGLGFFGKALHDHNIRIIKKLCPGLEIHLMFLCMGGRMGRDYVARRAEEFRAQGKPLDTRKVVTIVSPTLFSDETFGTMRRFIREQVDWGMLGELYGDVGVPPQAIDRGMTSKQPGSEYNTWHGTFARGARGREAIQSTVRFIRWRFKGQRMTYSAFRQWIDCVVGDGGHKAALSLPSSFPEFNNQPPDLAVLKEQDVDFFNCYGERDPIAPPSACCSDNCGNGKSRRMAIPDGHMLMLKSTNVTAMGEAFDAFYSTPQS